MIDYRYNDFSFIFHIFFSEIFQDVSFNDFFTQEI